MTAAQRFYGDRDLNDRLGIGSASALWDWIKQGATAGLNDDWNLRAGANLFYRGQPNRDYGLSPNLYRICYPICAELDRLPVTEAVMSAAERAIIAAMRDEGLGRRMTDGQLLMILQHHGIPTRLIDVSAAAPEALYFAVDREHSSDGRLFMLNPHKPAPLSLESNAELPWADAAMGNTRAKANWTKTVALVAEAPLDPRMQAQQGRFLVGGLIRRHRGDTIRLGSKNLTASEFPDITTLGINFLKIKSPAPNAGWGATGWTILVKGAWKPEILARLAHEDPPITADTMYPPIGEVARLALRVAKEAARQRLA